jgi:peptidoglycan/LPS O-acetylase OafA/YrhL
MVRLGEISYAFYMVHLIVMRVAEVWVGDVPKFSMGPAILLSAATFAVALALAWLAHTAIEVPGQQLMLGKRSPRVPAAPERQLVS